uniref:ARAD1A18348p n=1 Tax=Blastobotrys adeninivorans TaxID=409370 RepID=A0A060SZ80_BLAAD
MNWRSELGFSALSRAHKDAYVLALQRFLRMVAYGITTLILALFLRELNVTDAQIGYFMTLTLIGDVVLSYLVTFYADKLGRRAVLLYSSLVMSISGLMFAGSSNYWVLLLAATIGVISPSGDETGPFKSVEESTLAHLTHYDDRSDIFAWYNLMGTLGTAVGSLGGGFIIGTLQQHMTTLESYRAVFVIYSGLGGAKMLLNCFLSEKTELGTEHDHHQDNNNTNHETEPLLNSNANTNTSTNTDSNATNTNTGTSANSLSKETKRVMIRLCTLFALDSLGGGFMPRSWLVVYLSQKFGISEQTLGSIIFTTTMVGSVSVLASSAMYKRAGPVYAMVLTHFPAALFNILIPMPTKLVPSLIFLLGREATTLMDVVPRQVFLASVVRSEDRTKVMGIVNVVKTLSRSVGPTFTGHLAEVGHLGLAFIIAGCLETSHDAGLLLMFRNVHPTPQ